MKLDKYLNEGIRFDRKNLSKQTKKYIEQLENEGDNANRISVIINDLVQSAYQDGYENGYDKGYDEGYDEGQEG